MIIEFMMDYSLYHLIMSVISACDLFLKYRDTVSYRTTFLQ